MTSTERTQRIRQMQMQIDDDIGVMVAELFGKMQAVIHLVDELKEAKSTRPGVASLAEELKPQVERWAAVVQGVANKQAVL